MSVQDARVDLLAQGRPGTGYDWLAANAARRPDGLAVVEWETGGSLTNLELYRAVERARAGLGRRTRRGDRVVLVLPNAPSFPTLLFACLGAGLIAVPAPVPSVSRTSAFRERLTRIVADCGPALLVTEEQWTGRLTETLGADVDRCPVISWRELCEPAPDGRPEEPEPAAAGTTPGDLAGRIAFLQYTSGSTGRPRGVVVTHEALRVSCAQAAQAYAEQDGDRAVTWVPLFHDMGLVTGLMRPAFSGYPTVLVRPEVFVGSPFEWLRAIAECGGTISSAPNFAYELCVRKVSAEQVRGLDLRRWRVARNAGEVVRPETMARFLRHLAPAGLSAATMSPSYGMAEATLTVTTCGPEVPQRELTVSIADLDRGLVVPVQTPALSAGGLRTLLSSGRPVPETELLIQPDTAAAEGGVGEILIRGPQLSPGYWQGDSTPTELDPSEEWRHTGDLGFVHDGYLYVLGRIDDTIVYQGKNFYLSDLLAACSSIEALRPGRLAPFVIWDEAASLDIVCLVVEVRATPDGPPPRLNRLVSQVKQAVTQALELYVTRVEFVPAGSLPVTTSGKVRASETRRRYLRGELPLCPR